MTPDINVLVAASRSDHPHHSVARTWLISALEACASGGTIEILPMVAAGFLRLVTNKKIFPYPTPISEAIVFLQAMRAVPGVSMPELGREWSGVEQLCRDGSLAGNQIPDAWIAATVSASGYRLATFDRDFRKLLRPSQLTLLPAS